MDFPALQHSRKRRSTNTCGPTHALGRLQGLVTLLTGYSLRVPVGFVSRRRRSWACPLRSVPLSKGIDPFPNRSTHLPFAPAVALDAERRAGPTGRGSWALTLPKVPRDRRRLSPPTRRLLPWGFSLPGLSRKGLDPHFDRPPLTRLPNRPSRPAEADHRRRPDASQRLNQPLPGPNRSKGQALNRSRQPS